MRHLSVPRSMASLRTLMCGASMAALALGASRSNAEIVRASGQSESTTGAAINAEQVSGVNAFNKFRQFNLGTGDAATLVLPGGTQNLINVVQNKMVVDGSITSKIGDASGAVGGNLFFVTPNGLILGSTGQINTGRLIVRGGATENALTSYTPSVVNAMGGASLIELNGKVTAPGGIDVSATSVKVGAAGQIRTGQAAIDAQSANKGLVSMVGVVEGATLVAINGGIRIVGATSVAVGADGTGASTAVLDARGGTLGNAQLAGGIGIASAGAITLNGTLKAWDGGTGPAADVKIAASKTVTASDAPASVLSNYLGFTSADTSVTVNGGSIIGGSVTLSADSSASTAESKSMQAYTANSDFAQQTQLNALLGKAGLGLDLFYAHADAKTGVTVGAGASVQSFAGLSLTATSAAQAAGSASAQSAATDGKLAIALGVAELHSKATVTVGGTLTAGGTLTVKASNDARTDLSIRAISTDTAKAGAVAATYVDVDTKVDIQAGAALQGAAVTVQAINHQLTPEKGFSNKASTISKEGSAGGGAFALSMINVDARANMAGTIKSSGAVSVDATTRTEKNTNTAGAATGSGAVANLKSLNVAQTKDVGGLMTDSMKGFYDKYAGLSGGSDTDSAASTTPKAGNRIGAAVGILLNNQTAKTNVTGTIGGIAAGSAAYSVALTSLVHDEIVRNNVSGGASANMEKDGASSSFAGAAAWGDHVYTSDTELNGGITAGTLTVTSASERPRGAGAYDFDVPADASVSDIKEFAGDIFGKVSGTLGVEGGFFSSSAGAKAGTENAQQNAYSGSVSYETIASNSRAWINPGVAVTLSGDLKVAATNAIVALNLAGQVPLTGKGFSLSGGNAADGFAIAYGGITPVTVAGIGRGVTVTRAAGTSGVNADVTATTTLQSFSLSPIAGKANSQTGSGTFGINVVDGGETHATISKDAKLDLGTGKLTMAALSTLELWAAGGSVSVTSGNGTGGSSSASSFGVAGAINYVDLDTRALVGVATDDDSANAASVKVADAGITAGNVAITSTSTGSINAVSVAGSVTGTEPSKVKSTDPDSKPTGLGDKLKGKLNYVKGLASAVKSRPQGKYSEFADKYAGEQASAAAVKSNDAIAAGSPVTSAWGVAGSASINYSTLNTTVQTANAVFRKPAAQTGASSFLAQAAEGVSMLSVTGGAAIAHGKSVNSSTLIAGAFGLSYSENNTAASVSSTTLTDYGSVAVNAAANGTRIGAGLALAADATKTTDGRAIAGSVSVLLSKDGAHATVTDSSVTGGTGAFDVLSYNSQFMAAGAGGVAGGSGNAAGTGLSLVDIINPGTGSTEARLTRTNVSGFNSLSVRALNAARIAGVAAAGAISARGSEEGGALAASISINLVDFDSTAVIDVGNAGKGTINVGGAVKVYAGDLAKDATEALAGVGTTSGAAGTAMIGDYAIKATDFDSGDPVSASDLSSGTQILSIAVPVAGAKGNAAGVGLAWNEIDNDRTALVTGGANADGAVTIAAKSLSVQAVDHSAIMALGVGVGASTKGAGLMGSVTRNLIQGTSSAQVARATGAANSLNLRIGDADVQPGSVPNLAIGALADGGIFSLAGAIGIGKGGAGGVTVGVNDIVRNGTAGTPDAGLVANLDGVTLSGSPDTAITATSSGKILAVGFAGAASSTRGALGAVATANNLAPTINASASRLDYANRTPGDLRITARDGSTIGSVAFAGAVSTSGAGAGASIGVNQIDARVNASLSVADAASDILVRNLLVNAGSRGDTWAIGVGVAGGSQLAGAGSVAVNKTTSEVASLLTLTAGTVNASGSVGVVSTRDVTMNVNAGALAISTQGVAGGASVVVNYVDGQSSAKIVGGSGTLIASDDNGSAAARQVTDVRTGDLVTAFDPTTLRGLGDITTQQLADSAKNGTTSLQGVVVNASSTYATHTLAVTGAVATSAAAVAATAVVGNIGGTTTASITDTDVKVGKVGDGSAGSRGAANDKLGVDVRASTQSTVASFAGALAGAETLAVAAPVASDAVSGTTSALVKGGSIDTTGTVNVVGRSNQAIADLVVSAALSGTVSAAVAGVSPRFQATTTAVIETPNALVADGALGVNIDARSDARGMASFGTLAISGEGAGAGAVVVATNSNDTEARYIGTLDAATGLGTVTVAAPTVSINAEGDFQAMVIGASIAGSAGISLVGNGVGVVHRGTVFAGGDGLTYNRPTGTVNVAALEKVSLLPAVGQIALGLSPTGAGVSLGVIAVLSQSKVDAQLARPSITASAVSVKADGYNQIDAINAGLAGGAAALGANVLYVGVGAVTNTGALFGSTAGDGQDAKIARASGASSGGNKNLDQLSSGGSTSAESAAAPSKLSTADKKLLATGSKTGAATAFSDVGKVGTDSNAAKLADSHVAAQVIDTVRDGVTIAAGTIGTPTIAAPTLDILANSNLLSKTTNAQLTAGAVAGSATVAITRNAAQSIATLGAVTATGTGTATVKATTGQAKAAGAPALAETLSNAAEANIYAGTAGGIAVAVGVADVRLDAVANASSRGTIDYGTANIKAEDTTAALSNVVGAAIGGSGAVNIAVANATKTGTVAATLSGKSLSDTLNVDASGLGSTYATAKSGSGGVFFAGNAAVANATDTRTVTATVAERTKVTAGNAVNVTASATPQVNANTIGIAVSGYFAAGASVANATSGGTVGAYVGEGADFCPTDGCTTGALTVKAALNRPQNVDNVYAEASGSAGGALAAANGASAKTNLSLVTEAVVGRNLDQSSDAAATLGQGGLDVEALRSTAQHAKTFGLTLGGVLAVGIMGSETTADGTTRAALANVDGSRRYFTVNGVKVYSDATVKADTLDTSFAETKAGAGGLGAGVAAKATTNSNGSTIAEAAPAAGKTFLANTLSVTSRAGADYKANSDSLLATVAGGSGTTSENNVNTSAATNVGTTTLSNGSGSRIEAGRFVLTALNAVGVNDADGGTASGAGGGVVSGSAAAVNNIVAQNATLNVRDATTLRQYGGDPANNTFASFLDAIVTTTRNHAAALDVGGGMQFPYGRVNSTYTPVAAVNIGSNALLRADQGIGIGTAVTQGIVDRAAAQVAGLASAGGASTNATTNASGTITVNGGATIESMMDVALTAGRSSDATRPDALSVATQTDTFNWTLAPLSTEADADTTINLSNKVNIGAALIRSARDVTVQALGSTTNATAVGEGHNPYLELFSQTTGSGNTHGTSTGQIAMNGSTLVAGFLNNRSIAVGDDGSLSSSDAIIGANGVNTSVTNLSHTVLENRDSTNAQYDDRLGTYLLTTHAYDVSDAVTTRLTALRRQASQQGVTLPSGDDTTTTAWETAIASNDLVAKIAGLLDTQRALSATARGTAPDAAIIGGRIDATGLSNTGGLFASGGVIALNTNGFQAGSGVTVAANAAAKVNITNTSKFDYAGKSVSRDIVLGNITVPFKTSGAVTYGGAQGSWSGTGNSVGAISVTNGKSESSPRSDVVVLGTVNNLTGSLSVLVNQGNYVQFGAANVASLSADAPNGLFSVSTPGTGFSQGLPLAYYYGNYGYSLYSGGAQNPLSADQVATIVASWAAMRRVGNAGKTGNYDTLKSLSKSDDPMKAIFLDRNGDTNANGTTGRAYSGQASVIWGNCSGSSCEYASEDTDITNGTPTSRVGLGFSSSYYGDGNFSTPQIGFITPTYVADPGVGGNLSSQYAAKNADGTGAKNPSINANQVFINAKYVDLSGTITAGPTKSRQVVINDTVGSQSFGQFAAQGSDGKIDLAGTAAATGNIGATFVRTGVSNGVAQGYIQLADVSAGVGGWISITGKILNTNPTGNSRLIVRNGFADINVTNNTPYEIKLGALDAGLNVEGRITLRDKAADGTGITTIYTNAPGQAVQKQVITATTNTTTTLGQGVGLSEGNLETYTPTGRVYFTWSESRTVVRNPDINEQAELRLSTMSNWNYAPGGQGPQAADTGFVDLSTKTIGGTDTSALANSLRTALNGGNNQIVQITTGSALTKPIPGGFNPDKDGNYQNHYYYIIPYSATATITTGVKATNPIGIRFDQGGTVGGINVVSNHGGKITLTDALSYGGGAVKLTGTGAIATGEGGTITAKGLDLTAASIGADKAIAASLTGGAVTATATGGDVRLALSSASSANGTVAPIAINAVSATGAVNVSATAALSGVDRGAAYNVRSGAGGITLASTGAILGGGAISATDPLSTRGLVIDMPNAGVLKVTAGGDVAIQTATSASGVVDPNAVLRVSEITTPGNVLIRAQGSVVAAETTAQVDPVKLQRFLQAAKTLQLAPCTSDCVVDLAAQPLAASDVRAAGYAAYDVWSTSTDVAAVAAAETKLKSLFGYVPASRQSIATIDIANISRITSVDKQLRSQGQVAYSDYLLAAPDAAGDRLAAQRSRAAADALGKLQQIDRLASGTGIVLSADKSTIDWSRSVVPTSGELYDLALSLLRARVGADGSRDVVPLPSGADIRRGLQLYLDGLYAPIATLLPGSVPDLATATGASAQLALVSGRITDGALANWAGNLRATATATLTGLFGTVPTTADLGSLRVVSLADNLKGVVWKQTMLDVAVPSIAFVPVPDTQFETRKPVITANSVSIVSGNSIGAFGDQKTFTFNAAGFTGAASDRDLALAYLASAGPGDLKLDVTRTGNAVSSVSFTTRRSVPLQLNATGTVNAVAAANLYDLTSTATTTTSPVQGNIFVNNVGTLNVGSIVSMKGRAGAENSSCGVDAASAASCDGRVRLVADNIVGVAGGAASVVQSFNRLGLVTRQTLSDAAGRGLVMGGLVRLEASTGAIGQSGGGALMIDAHGIEVMRAANDISVVKRAPVGILLGDPTLPGLLNTYSFGNDMVIGDVFAGGRLSIDNPVGSFFVARLPSAIGNRNSRIVAGSLSARAAGDIGAADNNYTGLVGQFDVQAPVIEQFVAGYDYATNGIGVGPAPAGLPAGDAFLALRGTVQVGRPGARSVLGARHDINIGYIPDTDFRLNIVSDVYMGGTLSVTVDGSTTDGSITFAPGVRITAPGNTTDDGSLDLSRLALNLSGRFDLQTKSNIILGSLSAGGGTVQSTEGKITVLGTLYGRGGPLSPFTIDARGDINAGTVANGAISLLSRTGTVALSGSARATDLTIQGANITIAGAVTGRSASLTTTSSNGTLQVAGPILLNRDSDDTPSTLVINTRALTLSNIVSAADSIGITASRIALGANASLMNAATATLTAPVMVFERGAAFSGIADLTLDLTGASASGVTALPNADNIGRMTVKTPGSLTAGLIQATGDILLRSDGKGSITLNDRIATDGAVTVAANLVTFGANGGVTRAGALSLTAPQIVTAARTTLVSGGSTDIVTTGALALYGLTTDTGTITVGQGGFSITGSLNVTGTGFSVLAGGDVSVGGVTTLANGLALTSNNGAVRLGGTIYLRNTAGFDPLQISAGTEATLAANARIVGSGAAGVIVDAASVGFDNRSTISAAAVTIRSRGALNVGDILANAQQAVSLRAAGNTSVGAITGSSLLLANSSGTTTARGAISAANVTMTSAGDLTVNGLAAQNGMLTSNSGGITLNGTTRIYGMGLASTLTATAAKILTLNGATGASGGVWLTGQSIVTGANGYLSDADGMGAVQTLRADSINVRINTGSTSGSVPVTLAVSGRTSASVNDATFGFTSLRPITFSALAANQATISATTALTVTKLTMRDWLTLNLGGGTTSLQGAAAPASTAGRKVQTGSLTNAKLIAMIDPKGGNPGLQLNGTSR